MPITVPQGVTVLQEGNRVTVQGPKGELSQAIHAAISVSLDENVLTVTRPDDNRQTRALHGLTRALLANMVTGVSQGFEKRLQINGVGYRAQQDGDDLLLLVGFSHPVRIVPPEGITMSVDKVGTAVTVAGRDKQAVGQVAANIRQVRPPEPYKGKGIAYQGEVIRRKAGKAGRTGG
jgi:large subunit ribosomal protein L6